MLSELRHHLLCFFIPGLVALLSLPLHLPYDSFPPTLAAAAAVVALAYLTGHLLQSVAAIPEKFLPSIERRAQSAIPDYILEAARTKLSKTVNVDPPRIDPLWLYRLCHAWVGRNVDPARRPAYRTYESLYRGLGAALLVLAAALAARAIRGPAHLTFATLPLTVSVPFAGLVTLALPVLAAICFRTGRRFGALRVRHAILTFVTAAGDTDDAGETQTPPRGAGAS